MVQGPHSGGSSGGLGPTSDALQAFPEGVFAIFVGKAYPTRPTSIPLTRWSANIT